jgi:hypothetical protein
MLASTQEHAEPAFDAPKPFIWQRQWDHGKYIHKKMYKLYSQHCKALVLLSLFKALHSCFGDRFDQ